MHHERIREHFFDFFKNRGHAYVPSSSLIPAQDPTLLFTNAGMNQFKDCFLGKEKRSYTRAVTIQKCVRAGGKHNDLDNVGFTDRHLTFFEMMGNFSFGDYFKEDAIAYAWSFLTETLSLDPDRLFISVYQDDHESRAIWKRVAGFSDTKIFGLGADSNFWQMGDVGPCGPCTEIFYDRGPSYGCSDTNQCKKVACDCSRFLEIWNLVFMQFERQLDGTLKSLERPGVDTGMGLERLCVVLEDAASVFLTSLFTPIMHHIELLSLKTYSQESKATQAAFHVLADHIRSSAFLIADGAIPSNEGRGYVLRKIIRRAVLFCQKLSSQPIFPKLADAVIQTFGKIYPELENQKEHIQLVLESETEKFSTNVVRGSVILEQYFSESSKDKIISGTQAFKLYDTYGFPLELVIAASREREYSVDTVSFEKLMQKQKTQSGKKGADALDLVHPDIETAFTGYDELNTTSTIVALVHNNTLVERIQEGQTCYIIPQESPFFIVGGGQVPDQGIITVHGITVPLDEVRYIDNAIAILVTAPVALACGDHIEQSVDKAKRMYAMKNHTATHLLQAALLEYFGHGIKQSGSLVHPDYLRFDFTFHGTLSDQDIHALERIINQKIQENIPVTISYTSLADATKEGALAFFGDKYNADSVRVVRIENFSTELCGGTHVSYTGEIGLFKITESSTPAAGQRRIHAVTGIKSLELSQNTFEIVKQLSQEFKVKRDEVVHAVQKQRDEIKKLHQSVGQYKKQYIQAMIPELLSRVQVVDTTIPVGIFSFHQFSLEDLQTAAQLLIQKQPGIYVLYSAQDDKTIALVTADQSHKKRIDFGKLKSVLEKEIQFRGGITKDGLQGSILQKNQIDDTIIVKSMQSAKTIVDET